MKRLMMVFITAALLCGCTSAGKNGAEGTENNQQEESVQNGFAQAVEENIYTELPPDFLSDVNQELFKRAEYISFNAFVSTGFGMPVSQERETSDFKGSENVGVAYETDYMYSEFEDYIKSVFDGEALEKTLESLESAYFETSGGKLCWIDAARGTNIFYKDKTFELVNESEDKIEFKAKAVYSQEGLYESEEDFKKSGMEGEYEWTEEYNFELTKTDDGWRVTRFEYWK